MPLFFCFKEIVYSFKKELSRILISYTSLDKKDLVVLKHFLRSYKETANVETTTAVIVLLDLAHAWSLLDMANL